MELEEMKNTWNDLNHRMEKTEKLNNKLITEMLNNKHQSAMDKLRKFELNFLIFSIVFIFISLLEYYAGIFNAKATLLFEAVFVFSAGWQAYKLFLLNQMKIHTCNISELLQKAIRYKVLTRMHTVVGMFLLIPFFVFLFLFDEKMRTLPLIIAISTGAIIGLIIGLYYFFKNLRDIDNLIKSYKDIKEFEEA